MFNYRQRIYQSLDYLITWNGRIVLSVEGESLARQMCEALNTLNVENENDARYYAGELKNKENNYV